MSKAFVEVARFGTDRAIQFFDKFWVICPENIWRKKAGGWPVGQQFYHSLWATSMFIFSMGGEKIDNPDPQAGQLGEDRDYCPSKEDAKKFFNGISLAINQLLDKLDDEDLLKNNPGLSKMLGQDVNNAECFNMMVSHMLYHLGSCDAALRNEGLEGAW